MTAVLLGIDVGTSGSKVLLVDDECQVLASTTTEYSTFTPQPLWAEQNPSDWWSATVSSVRRLLAVAQVRPAQVAAVGLTGQMHGLVALDGAGQVLRPCIMWNDQRTATQCDWITQQVGQAHLLELTGNPVLPGFTAPKILWVREHESEVYRRIAHVLVPKDYVRLCLTGDYATDVSDASGTSLFEVGQRRWSDEMLRTLSIPSGWMPTCFESPEVTGVICEDAAALTGLLPGTPVVGGGGDQEAQAVGTGIIEEGLVSVTLGTSGVVFTASDSYRVEPHGRLHAFCHAVPGKWHLMGAILSAGGSLRWFRDALGETRESCAPASGTDSYDQLTQLASEAPAGCEGLLFLPYLTGVRSPYPDPHARGSYCGITLRHGRPHMVRAVLEGVAYGLRDFLELIRELGMPIQQLRGSGGGVRSALWRQVIADVFDTELATVRVTEGAAYGAALLAGVGVGVWRDVAAACTCGVQVRERVPPGPDAPRYADYYQVYRELYPALRPLFAATAQVVARHFDPPVQ